MKYVITWGAYAIGTFDSLAEAQEYRDNNLEGGIASWMCIPIYPPGSFLADSAKAHAKESLKNAKAH